MLLQCVNSHFQSFRNFYSVQDLFIYFSLFRLCLENVAWPDSHIPAWDYSLQTLYRLSMQHICDIAWVQTAVMCRCYWPITYLRAETRGRFLLFLPQSHILTCEKDISSSTWPSGCCFSLWSRLCMHSCIFIWTTSVYLWDVSRVFCLQCQPFIQKVNYPQRHPLNNRAILIT